MSGLPLRGQSELVCKPIQSYKELLEFIKNPPSWRSLCIDLKPHSKQLIKNVDVSKSRCTEAADRFYCHFDPEKEVEVERHEEKTLPKTLICHDMANGYHDDSFIDGTGNSEAYNFYNWGGIDVFCYFSHHFVTIPPLGWINVAHAHGVRVLGTVITEWTPGSAFWNDILQSPADWRTFASALVAVAKCLRFDGWLLNVENEVSRPDELVSFVRELGEMMHAELPAGTLLWYDSVTVDGRLAWQNGLNDKNRAFFDACDGIFTNYSWSEADVHSSAVAAGERICDVYVGIDVWGRNFFGGGKFNTHEAVKVAHEHGCSLAIFAPAWTCEAADHSAAHGLDKYRHFLLRDRALWDSLWPYLNTRLPCALPFYTSFCRGQGDKRRLYGEVLCPVPWYNLRHMQYQPNSARGPHGYRLSKIETGETRDVIEAKQTPPYTSASQLVGLAPDGKNASAPAPGKDKASNAPSLELKPLLDEKRCFEECFEDSFTGGSCLKVHPSTAERGRAVRLFRCDFRCYHSLVVCVVTKTLHPDQHLDVVLSVMDASGERKRVLLVGSVETDVAGGSDEERQWPLDPADREFEDIRRYMLLHVPGFYVPLENPYGWKVRYYVVQAEGARVTSVGSRAGLDCGPALFGHFGLCDYPAPPASPPPTASASVSRAQ